MVTLRLRRSEWRVLANIARYPDAYRSRRSRAESPLHRMWSRGLICSDEAARVEMTERGREAYLAHPINWGWPEGPANCH